MMSPEQKKAIDGMDFRALFSLWRHAPSGNAFFVDDTGDYFAKVMKEKRASMPQCDVVAASKSIGW